MRTDTRIWQKLTRALLESAEVPREANFEFWYFRRAIADYTVSLAYQQGYKQNGDRNKQGPGTVAYRGGVWGVQTPPPKKNSEDIIEVLDRMSKKDRRLDFLLQFTVFLYGCNLLNKWYF